MNRACIITLALTTCLLSFAAKAPEVCLEAMIEDIQK